MIPSATLLHERRLWASGVRMAAGVDEAGRGPLAGPVVAAAVLIEREHLEQVAETTLCGLTDSKQLTARRREAFFEALTRDPAVHVGLGVVEAPEIDRRNILRATHAAMAKALRDLDVRPEHALVDGLPVPGLPCASTALVGGDASSLLIAAASVLAKVTRDRMMEALDRRYPLYGFAAHKGYGTAAHLEALRAHGPCPAHRRSFAPVREAEAPRLGF